MSNINESLIEQLKQIGFSEYKAKVLLTLASGKIMSASEIVNEAKIIRGSIYDILKSFVKLGYCNEIETDKILQYQIIDPDIILDKIIKDQTKEHNNNLNKLKNTFTNIKEKYSAESSKNKKPVNIELIRGFNKHRVAKYKEFLLTAKKEICGMYTFKGLVSDEADEFSKKFIKRGGVIRSIYRTGLDFKISLNGIIQDADEENLSEVLRKYKSIGEDLRVCDFDIPNMTIIDGTSVFINTDSIEIPDQSNADIIMRNLSFAKYMKDLFEGYWKKSNKI
ncbi:MAG: Sugar-specific transcriptional regulator TrmB [Chlorobi bacterium OLB5]|nr:MAG: Sugar-specific transcriptional regulator TrmB [Chlorobi bacterium OLB5]